MSYSMVKLLLALLSIFIFAQGEENVTLRKTTHQSSDYTDNSGTGSSSKAVDGNKDADYTKGSCSHTYNEGTNWWCVDLQKDLDFESIKIFNRKTFQRRLRGFEIRVSSNGRCDFKGYQQSPVCYKDTSTTVQDIYNISNCNQPVNFEGRYVYISLENPNGGDIYLTLCEVEIFEKCERTCKNGCNSNGICNDCVSGYYGDKCDKPCPINCNGGCMQNNGDCEDCINGYWGIKCLKQCPTNCQFKCDKNNGYCSECKNYYWGDKCEKQCSANCKDHSSTTCYKTNGKCYSGCKTEWYGKTCQTKCNSNCINGCGQDTGRCTRCNDGYYGNECSNQCPITCLGNCDQDFGHCELCKSGIFGNYCNETCSTGCLPGKERPTCDRNGRCTVGCINGRYGEVCDGKCSTGCKNGTCNRKDGSCTSGCISGKSGWNCTEDCSTKCTICSQNDKQDCSQCYHGYYGQSCQHPCSKTCQSQNNNVVCDINNGYCTIGCIKGYYGDVCNKGCSNNCFDSKCYKSQYRSVSCTIGCIDGYKGSYCQDTCLDNCMSCNRYNDLCTSCKNGWFGDTCQTKCNSNCINGCQQATGDCLNGFIDGTTDRSCTEALGDSGGMSPIVAGIIGALVSMVLLSIIILVYCFLKKRKERCNTNKRTVMYTSSDNVDITEPSYENVHDITSSQVEAGPYESIDRRQLPSSIYETLK